LLETEFETFCDRIEKLALDARMERTHEKRETDHFYWLSRNLLKGESAAEIKLSSAKLQNVTTRAITKAIEALAKELELTPRKPESRMPRKRLSNGTRGRSRCRTCFAKINRRPRN